MMRVMCVLSPCRLLFGTLYPAYYSYKAVKTKNVKEYVSSEILLFIYFSSPARLHLTHRHTVGGSKLLTFVNVVFKH